MKSSEQLKEKWSAPLNSTTKSDCRAMLIEPMETKIVKPQMKLTKQGKSYQVEYNGTPYYRMSFSETSIGSWFQISNDKYTQVDNVSIIMELEQQFTTLELEPTIKGQDVFFVNLEDSEQYEEVDKTVTQQVTEYFDYDIDKAIEEQKEKFPNPDKLSYEDWKGDKYKGYDFDKVGYLMYLKENENY